MDEVNPTELEAAAFRRLVQHLRERTDVPNIELMELAGFCRNCLSRWYREAAEERGAGPHRRAGPRDRLRNALRGVEGTLPERAISRLTALGLLVAAVGAGCGADSGKVEGPRDPVLTPDAARAAREAAEHGPRRREVRSKARVVELRGAGSSAEQSRPPRPTTGRAPAPSRTPRCGPSCARPGPRSPRFRGYLTSTAYLPTGPRARVASDGTAVAPEDAPEVVKRVILAGNQIAKFPYRWGGGHGAWRDNGYDCSGSVSFALAGAGLLGRPLTSGDFIGFGGEGPGDWITIYTNPGHVFMVVAGLRFDTSGARRAGRHPLAAGAPQHRGLRGAPRARPVAAGGQSVAFTVAGRP